MARLEEAQKRLEKALTRLETAAGGRSQPVDAESLKQAEARCARLEAREQEVARRLDAAIDRLRAVLGR
jgi:hypothetical protein